MSKTILAVGAHIGDMELTCGALLAANAVHGGRSVTLALTAGEKGAPAGADVAEYRKSKIAEAEAFAAELGGEAIVLDYPDGLLPDNDEARFAVCDVIRRVKPDILITHHAHSMHKDHAACRRIVTDAWFYAAIEGFERDLPRHFARHLYYAENWEDAEGFQPYVYLDVSEGLCTLGKGHRATLVRRTQHELSLQGILFPSQAPARHRGAEGVLRVLYDPHRADAHRQKTGG